MSSWLLAIALVLFLEGAVIAIAPRLWQESMRQLTTLPHTTLRKFGAVMVAAAFLVLLVMI